ncbi:MAG: TRC40/GET3/ArsA family transport-energizing ATPase [Anaerolineae bacterium]|nr:TRC40/GET3/ArsA family transport-energizing ATPase [Anaerolineae bacterium]
MTEQTSTLRLRSGQALRQPFDTPAATQACTERSRSDTAFLSNPNLRFILFGGKGGTGKTTSASATAIHFARQRLDKKVLLVSTDPAHSLSDSLDREVGSTVTPIEGVDNLFALALDAEALLEEFMAQHGAVIRLIADRGTYLDKEDVASFFELSMPGLDEVMAIIEIMDLMREGHYDLVILDTAPAGHTIRLLALPEHMEQWIHVMDMMMEKHRFMVKTFHGRYVPDEADRFLQTMTSDVERVRGLLKNAQTTEFVPVVNPEAMSIYETETLFKALSEGDIPVRTVILNRLAGSRPCPFCQARENDQAPYRREIEEKFARYSLVTMPLFPHEIRGLEDLTTFAGLLFDQGRPPEWTITAKSSPQVLSTGLSEMKDLLEKDLRFILFGGKGGVGKTTLSAATALEMARREPGKKTLIFSTDPAGSLADSLGCAIGDKPTPVEGVSGLYAMQINAEDRLEELKQRYTDEINEVFDSFLGGGGMDIAFDKEVMLELITLIPPGLDEIIALISIMDLLEEGTYDRFILDMAPTGHMLRFLELPALAMDWFKTFFRMLLKYQGLVTLTKTARLMLDMSKGVKKVRGHLVDAQRSEFVAVTIPEAMGVFETQRFLVTLDQMQIPCRHLVINMVIPPTECDFCLAKREEQQGYIRGLREQFSHYAVTEVPLFPHEIRGVESLSKLSEIYG